MRSIVITDIVLAHRYSAVQGWQFHDHRFGREYHGIVFVLEGRAIYCFDDHHKVRLEKGMCLYLPKNTHYSAVCESEEGFDHLTVNFRMTEDAAISAGRFCVRPESSTGIRQLFTKMVHEWNERHLFYREHCMGVLYELIAEIMEERQKLPYRQREKLMSARIYMEEHFREDFPMTMLAGLCGMSETYFRRQFQKIFHETPVAYQTRRRIEYACDLLILETYKITEVANLCGYSDPAYFSRVFKNTTGVCPTQYHLLVSRKD